MTLGFCCLNNGLKWHALQNPLHYRSVYSCMSIEFQLQSIRPEQMNRCLHCLGTFASSERKA